MTFLYHRSAASMIHKLWWRHKKNRFQDDIVVRLFTTVSFRWLESQGIANFWHLSRRRLYGRLWSSSQVPWSMFDKPRIVRLKFKPGCATPNRSTINAACGTFCFREMPQDSSTSRLGHDTPRKMTATANRISFRRFPLEALRSTYLFETIADNDVLGGGSRPRDAIQGSYLIHLRRRRWRWQLFFPSAVVSRLLKTKKNTVRVFLQKLGADLISVLLTWNLCVMQQHAHAKGEHGFAVFRFLRLTRRFLRTLLGTAYI